MPRIEPELQRLQDIKSLPSLIKYLKTDLNWPIESDDVEDVTFEYDPAELGFDTASTAKIEEVRQLRPLTPGQKWGIFWVKFGKKKLPVQMLRRALGNLVVKKRASTKKSDKAVWHMHDLLFISAYGDDSNRHITFAHFSESEDSEKSLPVLKVLGWDEDDTLLHLKDTYKTLLSTLNWETTPTDDPEAWRNHWSSAFKVGHRDVINTTKELVVELAHLATVIKKSVLTSIKVETEKGPWKKLMLAFQKTLIKDLDDEQFADVIAQTISYGLLTARLSSDGPISLKNLVDMVPATNPFLKELLQHFLTSAGMKGLFDVDEAGINDVVELLNRANAQAIRNDFGKKTAGEDPVIHFYEHFLGAYNKELKVERGVFYTPQPVVSYIVRSVHELLQTEFGLEDGLADTSTWADVQKKHQDLKIPEGIKDPMIEPFVQILDPATGTATFLIEVIEVIYNTMKAKWDKECVSKSDQIKKWNSYVPIHLLPRLYAYELMMAPYAIAHMKVGLKLTETGFTAWETLGSYNRANIFLTNALEPWAKQLDLPGFDALAHEAAAVNEAKRRKYFSVIIGNPPYAIHSGNLTADARAIVERYKIYQKETIKERGALQFEKNLQNDYVKFIRLSELIVSRASLGVVGFITSHAYLSNRTLRGMRESLIETFQKIFCLNLHGNSASGEATQLAKDDKNVFDITEGVSIGFFCKTTHEAKRLVEYQDLTGVRDHKYSWLRRNSLKTSSWIPVRIGLPLALFKPSSDTLAEFECGLSLDSIFPQRSAGVITARDAFATDEKKSTLIARVEAFAASKLSGKALLDEFNIKDKKGWDVDKAKRQALEGMPLRNSVHEYYYRPFDFRYIAYNRGIVWGMAYPTLKHTLGGGNLVLISMQQYQYDVPEYCYAFVSTGLTDSRIFVSKTGVATLFPLYLKSAESELSLSLGESANFSSDFIKYITQSTELKLTTTGVGTLAESGTIGPEAVFYLIYAQLHSHSYRTRYSDPLRTNYPRIFVPKKLELLRNLVKFGANLTELHTKGIVEKSISNVNFFSEKKCKVEKPTWAKDTVWIDKAQTTGFKGVLEEVWNFHIGGYQVCEKWLKERKGRNLTNEDIEHYQKIIVVLSETIRLMVEIDKTIDEYGGWPGAFQTSR
jgi:predicted helicase